MKTQKSVVRRLQIKKKKRGSQIMREQRTLGEKSKTRVTKKQQKRKKKVLYKGHRKLVKKMVSGV